MDLVVALDRLQLQEPDAGLVSVFDPGRALRRSAVSRRSSPAVAARNNRAVRSVGRRGSGTTRFSPVEQRRRLWGWLTLARGGPARRRRARALRRRHPAKTVLCRPAGGRTGRGRSPDPASADELVGDGVAPAGAMLDDGGVVLGGGLEGGVLALRGIAIDQPQRLAGRGGVSYSCSSPSASVTA